MSERGDHGRAVSDERQVLFRAIEAGMFSALLDDTYRGSVAPEAAGDAALELAEDLLGRRLISRDRASLRKRFENSMDLPIGSWDVLALLQGAMRRRNARAKERSSPSDPSDPSDR